jgi:hypothetical protein
MKEPKGSLLLDSRWGEDTDALLGGVRIGRTGLWGVGRDGRGKVSSPDRVRLWSLWQFML